VNVPESTALVNIGELSKPATVLIEKVSEAVGGIFAPWQIRRRADAEAEAERIHAVSHIEITDLQRRAFQRFMVEEAKKQSNIEAITAKALPQVAESAEPQKIEDDWLSNFFDKSKLISNEEMQAVWSKVLAGEANSPGKFSKRTINFLSSLDKSDASLFQSLCGFGWLIGQVVPIIYEVDLAIYKEQGITFTALQHLDEIGLISFGGITTFQRTAIMQKRILVSYYGASIMVEFEKETDNAIPLGYVLLSKVGQELAPICGSKPIPAFFDYVLDNWIEQKHLCLLSPISHPIDLYH
jgi:Protein of unknown function (DUF2806)